MKILVIAFALSPSRGSEAAIAWGWTTGLAAVHDVTVVSRSKEKDEVLEYLREHPAIRFKPVWIDQPGYAGPMAAQFNYLVWLRRAQNICETLTKRESFDILHHVSYGSVNTATSFWKLDVPVVLGPLGGGQTLDPMFQSLLGKMPMAETLRNLRVSLLPQRPAIRKMIQGSRLILVTNKETGRIIEKCGGKAIEFCDSGVQSENLGMSPPARSHVNEFRMLWTGRMLFRKGVPIIFRAMQKTGVEKLVLDLVGAGPMENEWRKIAEDCGIKNRVRFHGRVPFSRVFDFYDNADLFVFPSVNDAFGSQLLEACARGLPCLVLNHQGAGTLLPDSVAWKVNVSSTTQIVDDMAKAMLELAGSPERLSAMSRAAVRYASTELWPSRIQRVSELYEQTTADAGRITNVR